MKFPYGFYPLRHDTTLYYAFPFPHTLTHSIYQYKFYVLEHVTRVQLRNDTPTTYFLESFHSFRLFVYFFTIDYNMIRNQQDITDITQAEHILTYKIDGNKIYKISYYYIVSIRMQKYFEFKMISNFLIAQSAVEYCICRRM